MGRLLKRKVFKTGAKGQALWSVPQGSINKLDFFNDIAAIIQNNQTHLRIGDAEMGIYMGGYKHYEFKSLRKFPGRMTIHQFMKLCLKLGIEIDIKGVDFKG